jgi:dolichol-phosphate mannosyltransferase
MSGTLDTAAVLLDPTGPVWVIVPTYNERENLLPLVKAVRAELEELTVEHTVLIVDDSSPDGTGELASRLARDDPSVEVLHRPRKLGLGPAYIDGFRRALEAGAQLIVEMDADFSHDPAHLRAMLEAARRAELVLGSRYVEGGGVRNWGRGRRIVSRGGCWYARAVLGVPVSDLTGGFKCFRREVLEAIDLDGIHAQGYAFQVELTYRAIQMGFRVVEVPIVFTDRRVGQSKMTRRIVLEAAWMVPVLRLSPRAKRPEQAVSASASRVEGDETGHL